MSITITRKFTFDAGHRVLGHESKCKHLHGHTYHVELTVQASELDSLGRVIDFSVLKDKVGAWINDNLDHNMILHPKDPIAPENMSIASDLVFGGTLPYIMPAHTNPTAENIAKEIFDMSVSLLRSDGISVVSVKVHETPNCSAVYSR